MNSVIEWVTRFFQGIKPWITVLPWERAVRCRFGRFVKLFEPGFYLKIPIVDEYVTVNSRLRVTSTRVQTLTTRDNKIVTVVVSVGFKITDPLLAFRRFQSPEGIVAVVAATSVGEYVSSRNLPDITHNGIQEYVLSALKESAEGFEVEFIMVVDFAVVRTYRFLQDYMGQGGTFGEPARPGVNSSY